MPRRKRDISSTGIYHILLRGINQQRIFEKAEDYGQFLDYLSDVKKLSGFTLFAYCLLGNHVHLLLKEGAEPLAQIFKRLGTRYVQWFNRKYKRSGQLFQDRFISEAVEDDSYFMTILLYIYQNPVKARICLSTTEYEWCSRRLLGQGDGIVDETALKEIVPVSGIKKRELELIEEDMVNMNSGGRRATFTDKEVSEILRMLCGVKSTSDFQGLPRDDQKSAVAVMRGNGVPIRQIARLTGIGKGKIENWGKK